MVTDAVGCGTQSFAIAVVVGVNDAEREFHPHVDHELANPAGLFGREGEFLMNLRSNRPVGVIPGVVNAAIDQRAQPVLGQEIVDVRLAEAGRQTNIDDLLTEDWRSVRRPCFRQLSSPRRVRS